MKSFPVFFGWFFPFSKEHSLFYGIFLKLLIPGFFSWGILLLYALSLFSPHSFVLSFFFFFVIEILTEEFIYIWGSALIGSSIYVAGVKLLSFLPSFPHLSSFFFFHSFFLLPFLIFEELSTLGIKKSSLRTSFSGQQSRSFLRVLCLGDGI